MNNKGITLIETILYITIVSILLVALMNFGGQITLSRLKAQSLEEIQQNARFGLHRISIDVHNTQSINPATQDDFLHLDMDLADLTDDIYYTLNQGQLTRQVGNATPEILTSDQVNITELIFTEITNENDFRNIKINITLQDISYGQRSDFNNRFSLETALTLRQ